MESKEERFYAYRLIFLERSQASLTARPIPSPKGRAVLPAIGHGGRNRGFVYRRRDYAFVGFFPFGELNDQSPHSERFHIGRIAKSRTLETTNLVPGDVLAGSTETWEAVWAVFDVQRQIVLVQHKHNFGSAQQIRNVLAEGLTTPVENDFNLILKVDPITDPVMFWSVVDNHDLVFRISLNLVSPNILDTNRAARDALAEVRALFGNDDLTVRMDSEAGGLTPHRETLGNWLEYIGLGEGWWELLVKNLGDRKKKLFSSRKIALDTTVEVPSEGAPEDASPDERLAIKRKAAQNLVEAALSVLENAHDRREQR